MNTQQQSTQSQRWLSGSSNAPFAIEATVLDERTATQVVTDSLQNQAVRGVAFQRDEYGTPHIRVELKPEAVSQFQDHIRRLTEPIQRSYESAGSYGSQ